LRIEIDARLVTLLDYYAEFVDQNADGIGEGTICVAFEDDPEFHRWLVATHPEDAAWVLEPADLPPGPESARATGALANGLVPTRRKRSC
jgi:hypothetical protein